jgi:hypothetical protein
MVRTVRTELFLDTIDLSVAPQRSPSLAQVTVGDEVVAYAPSTGRTCRLNAVAATVWGCLDGSCTLAELAEDIAVVSGWQQRDVEADLIDVVRGFARQGLLDGVESASSVAPGAAGDAPEGHRARLIRVPPGACTQRNDTSWAATRAVRAGDYLLGVRSATPALDELVCRTLAGHLVDDVEAPPNYSLRLAATGGVRYHVMFRDCQTPVRTRSLCRLLRALCGFLDSHVAEQDSTAVHVEALVMVRDGVALLLPAELRPLLTSEEHLRRRGFRVLDALTAALDPATGRLLARKPSITVDGTTLAAAAALETEPDEALPTVELGDYPVRFWIDIARRGAPPEASTPAALVARANRRVRNRTAIGAQTALSTLADVASSAHHAAVPAARHTSAVLDHLVALLEHDD